MGYRQNVAQYYDSTLIHYRKWWDLDRDLSLHYGIWEDGIKSFSESLANTNLTLLGLAKITGSDRVLDAGCGVGGAAFHIHETTGARVLGLSISKKQIEMAAGIANERNLAGKVSFKLMDFTNTDFESGSFDVIWACESVCHVEEKSQFLNEAWRLLKKDGRLILSDFFVSNKEQSDTRSLIRKWSNLWSMHNLIPIAEFKEVCLNSGFRHFESYDYTDNIRKSARRLYLSSLLGAIPSELYNLTHPNVTKYARKHYLSGVLQYKALRRDLWKYFVVKAIK